MVVDFDVFPGDNSFISYLNNFFVEIMSVCCTTSYGIVFQSGTCFHTVFTFKVTFIRKMVNLGQEGYQYFRL